MTRPGEPPMTEESKRDDACARCGMVLNSPREYHPFAACILMEHYRNGNHVRMVLEQMAGYFARGGTLDDISTAHSQDGEG